MKRQTFLLTAVFLLAAILLLLSPLTALAAPGNDPAPVRQPSIIDQVWAWRGGFLVALAVAWLLFSGIIAVRDMIITRKEHGSGFGHW